MIFSSFSEAARGHADRVRKYPGTVVSCRDSFFAALNAAVFRGGAFACVPPGVR